MEKEKEKSEITGRKSRHTGLAKGYVQLYFGDGKGKTTAAIGLAVRAAGCGLKVFIGQFIKGLVYSEIKCLRNLSENITVRQYGRGCFIRKEPAEEDIFAAKKGLSDVKKILLSGKYDVVILDEITIAEYFKLISVAEILELINLKPQNVELVLTGRKADSKIIEAADLVTEMKEIKHYYTKNVQARKGIEK
jgi:cob(I)alamin adenosyltransferase